MARRSENRGFASMDPEQRRRIASEGGRASHGGRGRSHEDDYDEDYDDDYDEDDDRNVSNRYEDEDDDRYNDDDDYDYDDSGYEDEDEYDDEDDRGWQRSRQGRGGRSSNSRRGFASMDPDQQRRIARMGGEATARTHGHDFYEEIGQEGGEAVRDEYGPQFYSRIGRMGGRARWDEDYDDRGRGSSHSGGSRRSSSGNGSSRGRSSGRSSSSNRGRSNSSSRRSSSGRRGFGSMPREEVRRIARMGGRASHSGGRGRGRSSR